MLYKYTWQAHLVRFNGYLLFVALAATAISFYVGEILTLFALIAIICLSVDKLPRLSTQDKVLVIAFMSHFALELFNFFYHGQASLHRMSIDIEAVVAVLLLLYFIQRPVSEKWIYGAFACGATIAGVFGLWQVIWLDSSRALGFGFRGPGIFGNLSLLSGYIALIGALWAYSTKQSKYIVLLCVLGVLGGVAASITSSTRSGWTSIPVISMIIGYMLLRWRICSWRTLLIAVITGCAAIIVLYLIPATSIQKRVHDTYNTAMSFQQDITAPRGEARLDMWRSVFLLADRAPVFGLGKEGYVAAQAQLFEEGVIGGDPNHDDPHNEILMFYMYYGALGVLVFAVFYGAPLLLAVGRMITHIEIKQKFAALAMAVTIITCLILGLTADFLGPADLRRNYFLLIVLFWVLCRPSTPEQHTTSTPL